MFHRAFDIQGAITTVDVINIDDDLRLALELLFFHFLLGVTYSRFKFPNTHSEI